MKEIISKILFCSLIVILCVGVIGCSHPMLSGNSDDTSAYTGHEESDPETDLPISGVPNDDFEYDLQNADYSIIKHGEKTYIVFDDISVYQNNGTCQLASLEFSSIADFKDAVTNGKLEKWQKNVISTAFEKNDAGILTCDFKKLLEPCTPANCIIDGVSWSGETYSFYLSTSSETFGFIHNYTESQFNYIYTKDFLKFFDRETITVEETKALDGGKTVTTYSTSSGQFMQIRYTLYAGDRTVTVDETYRLGMVDSSINTSSTVPSNVTLYCEYAGAYYVVDLFGFSEKPSEAWLSEFGMKPYIDQNVVDK